MLADPKDGPLGRGTHRTIPWQVTVDERHAMNERGARVLEKVISPDIAELYQRLLEYGVLPLDENGTEGNLCQRDERVAELERLGLAASLPGQQRLVPQPPMAAFQHLLTAQQQRIGSELETLALTFRQLDQAQRAYSRSLETSADQQLARVLTDPDEMEIWADHLLHSAEWECLRLETAAPTQLPDEQVQLQHAPAHNLQRGVRYRGIYAREWLEGRMAGYLCKVLEESGEQARFLSGLTLRMRIADKHTALVGLKPLAQEGTLLLQAPHFIAALRQLFEQWWEQAQPLTITATSSDDALTAVQQHVLRLLVAGLKDEAIARAAGISVKTVRRHVAHMLDRLGADTRFAAGAAAVRHGWLA